MHIDYVSGDPATLDVEVMAVVTADLTALPPAASALDQHLGGSVGRAIEREHLRADKPDVVSLTGTGSGPHRVVLLGVGKNPDGASEALRATGGRLAGVAGGARATNVVLDASGLSAGQLAEVVEGFVIANYKFDTYKSNAGDDDAPPPPKLESLQILGASDEHQTAISRALTVAEATNWTRYLANAPGNKMVPAQLADEAEKLASEHEHLSIRVLDRAAIFNEGLGLLSAVGQGSRNEERLIVLEWNPPGVSGSDDERLTFVGKAVTFDSGGISIKPSAGMHEMRVDKAGGCAVLGAMRAIAELAVPRRILAVVASTENMPDGIAYKPGDVITAYDGTTVEITNTDAEGRLALADAIAYARNLGCGQIVELSTLTGAMVIALGSFFAGLISDADDLTTAVLASSKRTGEHAWHLPMHEHFKESMKSQCADLVNSGDRYGGSLSAGAFLKHFAKDTPFVHLDIAGTSMLSKPRSYLAAKGATGWGVRLLTDLASTA